MKIFTLSLSVLLPALLFAQTKYVYRFEPLEVIDTIHSQEEVNQLRAEYEFVATGVFVKEWLTSGVNYTDLFRKQGNHWLALSLPPARERLGYAISSDGNFLTYRTEFNHGARETISDNEEFYIVDLITNSFLRLTTYSNQESWSYTTSIDKKTGKEVQQQSEVEKHTCKAEIALNDNILTVISEKDKSECIESGVYEIKDNRLTKIREYSYETKAMHPVKWVGNICIGMSLEDLKNAYPTAGLKTVPLNAYGEDNDLPGYEVWLDNRLLFFVVLLPVDGVNTITSITSVWPGFSLGRIHTGMSLEELLQYHPDLELKQDLISDWEYTYLKEDGMVLFVQFKTDESNRAGVYDLSKDETAVKIINKNVKIDLITVSEWK